MKGRMAWVGALIGVLAAAHAAAQDASSMRKPGLDASVVQMADPRHQAAFKQKYGYELAVPKTWEQFRDVAEYFNGKDLNGDGAPDQGLSLPLKVGAQDMFYFMSLSAPFVIGPNNPKLYWFDPRTMKPLIESPGHVRALEVLVDLVQFGTYLKAGWDEADIRDYSQAYFDSFSNTLQFPYLRIPGTVSYWQALDMHLGEAVRGQLSAEEALKATAVDFEEITLRLGRERQRRVYRTSLGV